MALRDAIDWFDPSDVISQELFLDLFCPADLSLMLFELFFSLAFRFIESYGHYITYVSCITEIGSKLFSCINATF